VAANLGLTFRGSYYYILPSYDNGSLARYSPGTIHLRGLMRGAIDLGLGRFDFTIGDEQYKRKWCDSRHTLYDHMVPVTPRGWPVARLIIAARGLKRFIKQTPVLWHICFRLRVALRGGLKDACEGTYRRLTGRFVSS